MADIAASVAARLQQENADDLLYAEVIAEVIQLSNQAVSNCTEIAQAIVSENLVQHFVDFIATNFSDNWLVDVTKAAVIDSMLSCLLNVTDASLAVCRQLSQQQRFFDNFFRPLLVKFELSSDSDITSIVQQAMDIVYNMYFQNDTEVYNCLAQYELVPCVQPHLKNSNVEISTSALLLIAFAVDERQAEIFKGAKTNISFLIKVLRQALGRKNRTASGFSAVEAAKCINRLALNDGNKELLVSLKLLPVVQQLLQSDKRDEVEQGMEILFTLSFSEANVGVIRKDFKEIIDKLRSDPSWASHKSLNSLMFHIGIERHRPQSAAQQQQQQQHQQHKVMISYNHASRSTVQALYTAMRQQGLEPWVDFEHMQQHESTLDAMAEAVDSANVVLVCYSRLYKDSNNCRLEAEYAWKRGKRLIPVRVEPKYQPTGWLGLLLGTQLYYDLTATKCSFESKFHELMVALQNSNVPKKQQQQQHHVPSLSSALTKEHSFSSSGSPFPVLPPVGTAQVRSWDAQQVAAWCSEHKLCEKVSSLHLTGCELQFLANTLRRSPEYFGRVLEAHVPLSSLQDLAKFVLAIEGLPAADSR